jgi:hypothetical protein
MSNYKCSIDVNGGESNAIKETRNETYPCGNKVAGVSVFKKNKSINE